MTTKFGIRPTGSQSSDLSPNFPHLVAPAVLML